MQHTNEAFYEYLCTKPDHLVRVSTKSVVPNYTKRRYNGNLCNKPPLGTRSTVKIVVVVLNSITTYYRATPFPDIIAQSEGNVWLSMPPNYRTKTYARAGCPISSRLTFPAAFVPHLCMYYLRYGRGV